MAILNYTTSVPAEKSCQEIQKKLAIARAAAIMQEFDDSGIITHISFRMATPHGVMTFRLPCNVDKVWSVLQKTKGVEKRYRTKEHAARVAWRIIKDWVEAQLAIIETEMVTLTQVFLPYAQNTQGETVYDALERKNFTGITDQSKD